MSITMAQHKELLLADLQRALDSTDYHFLPGSRYPDTDGKWAAYRDSVYAAMSALRNGADPATISLPAKPTF